MSNAYECRLCLKTCTEYKSLFNETGQTNDIYDLAVTYFQPMVEHRTALKVLFWKCWHTIDEFQQFRLSHFYAYQKLLELEVECLSQKSDEDFQHVVTTNDNPQEDEDRPLSLLDQESIEDDSLNSTDTSLQMECNDDTPKFNLQEEIISDVGDSITSYRLLEKRQLEATIAKWRETLKCGICGHAVSTYDTLLRHFKRSHPKDKCHIKCCNCKISGLACIEEHARCHMGTSHIQCIICEATFEGFTRLDAHQKDKHPTEDCFIRCCKQKLNGRIQYEKHFLDHLNPCNICGCPLTKYNMDFHMKRMHPKNYKRSAGMIHSEGPTKKTKAA